MTINSSHPYAPLIRLNDLEPLEINNYVRIHNALRFAGIHHAGAIAAIVSHGNNYYFQGEKIRRFGGACYTECERALECLGLRIGEAAKLPFGDYNREWDDTLSARAAIIRAYGFSDDALTPSLEEAIGFTLKSRTCNAAASGQKIVGDGCVLEGTNLILTIPLSDIFASHAKTLMTAEELNALYRHAKDLVMKDIRESIFEHANAQMEPK